MADQSDKKTVALPAMCIYEAEGGTVAVDIGDGPDASGVLTSKEPMQRQWEGLAADDLDGWGWAVLWSMLAEYEARHGEVVLDGKTGPAS